MYIIAAGVQEVMVWNDCRIVFSVLFFLAVFIFNDSQVRAGTVFYPMLVDSSFFWVTADDYVICTRSIWVSS